MYNIYRIRKIGLDYHAYLQMVFRLLSNSLQEV